MSKTSSLAKRSPKLIASQPEELTTQESAKWSAEEESKLVFIMEKTDNPVWPKLCKQFPGKTAVQCQAKWQEILKRESKKGNWTLEEDELLKKWVRPTNFRWRSTALLNGLVVLRSSPAETENSAGKDGSISWIRWLR